MISLVGLSTRLPFIAIAALRERLSTIFARPFAEQPGERNAVVDVDETSIAVRVDGRKFGISLAGTRYMKEQPDEEIREQSPEIYSALKNHRCFVAVDSYEKSIANEPQTYQVLGKILAECVDEHALAVYSTQFNRLSPISDRTVELLTGPAPWRAAGLPIRPATLRCIEHPLLERAASEARDRWPELVDAWKSRPQAARPMVKGKFGDPSREQQMWVRVESIGRDWVGGWLDNEPAGYSRIKLGDRVMVDTINVIDWAYLLADESPVGRFTDNALYRLDEILP